ncbi:MAG: delta-60 repeat domain-containing protein, partial [Sterolibacterium sp.]
MSLAGSIVGSWEASSLPELKVFSFLQDGTYMGVSTTTGGSGSNTDGTPGMERGTYSLDLNTGYLTMTMLVDTNGHWGASDKNSIGTTYLVPVTTLTSSSFIAGGPGSDPFTLISSATSTIVGTWFLSKNDYHVAITFKSDGTYMQAEDGPVDGSSGHTGMDSGTYTWNSSTGALTCTTTLETDGGWSLFNAQVNSVIVSGDSAILHSPTEGDNTFSRVIASNKPVAAASNTAPSFGAGGSGKVTTDFGVGDFGASVALQSDGKILLAGAIDDDFALLRYNANGSLDTSFDGDGKVTTDMGGSDAGHAIALQADGKILVAGEVHAIDSDTNYGVVRYNADGGLDVSFAGSGKLVTDFSGNRNGNSEKANSIVLQADGKILVAGSLSTYINGVNGGGFTLARYNTDGSLDTNFGSGGKVTTSFGDDGNGYSVALQTDGKILVTGSSYIGGVDRNDFTLARYNTDGSLDTGFDGDGKVTTDFGGAEYGMNVTVQADGKILVAGTSFIGSNNFALARYNTDGSLDANFDGDGKLTTDLGGSDHGFGITLQSDGKILVAGDGGSGTDIALARYNTDGNLDTSFDGDGKLTTDFGGTDESYSIRLQSDGKILVAGTRSGATDRDFALARYNIDGSLDTSFGSGSSNTLDGAPSYSENNSAVVLDNSVQVVDAELAAIGNYAGATLTLSRHGGANAEDSYSATGSLGTLTQGGNLVYGGTSIGTVSTNASGTLLLTFNSNATQTLVNNTLSAIAYANSSDTPPASV